MSMCDKCYAPGACCRRMPINLSFWDDEDVQAQFDALIKTEAHAKDATATFTVLEKQPGMSGKDESGREYSRYFFSCPHLLPSGRCGQYEQRPNVCRIYEPMQDGLCVHFQGAEGTDEGL